MCYTLPKVWMGRIQKYWDKFIPANIPQSDSEFSLNFEEDEKAAVIEMESSIGTEDPVITAPEGTYLTNYVGVYNVDATPGVVTLLSPEKVNTENVLVKHYNSDTESWDTVEGVEIRDGYIWGSLDSYSPIAVFEYKKDAHVEESIEALKTGLTYIVCEGNTTQIVQEDNKVYVVAGTKKIEVTGKTAVIGGSIDGTYVEKTSISAKNITIPNTISKIYGGSFYYSEDTDSTAVGSVNVYVEGCTEVKCITGSAAAVRTEEVNIKVVNSKFSWIAVGESYVSVKNKDVNTADCSFASRAWVKKANIISVGSEMQLLYSGGNTGCLFVNDTTTVSELSKIDYLLSGGSNGCTKDSVVEVKDSVIGIYQSTNRGDVKVAKATFTSSNVEKLFVGGDATDSTVTGTTKNIRIDINAGEGEYTILRGVEGGSLITAEQIAEIVNAVKVSRNTSVTISNELVALLGNKYIVK